MPRRVVLLDTSFVIALENRADQHHAKARELDRQLLRDGAHLILHWGIIMELGDGYARVARRVKGYQLLDRILNEDRYSVLPLTDDRMRRGAELYFSRPDKEWGLTDCVSFALMEEQGITEVLTADIHFQQAGFNALLLRDKYA